MNLASFASACDRTGVSDRAAAIIASSILHDNAGYSETNPSLVLITKILLFCTFDGRKDQTMTKKVLEIRKKLYRKNICHLLEYFGHFALKKVSANAIANGMFDFLSVNHKEKNDIIAIGFDGTSVNTGAKGGAMTMIKLKLNKPVHWFICQLQ